MSTALSSAPKPKLKTKPQPPPRKSSAESLLYPPRQHTNTFTSITTGRNPSSHVPSSSISSFHSVSLSSDTDTSAPGSVTNFIATYPVDLDQTPTKKNHDADDISLTESYENVSTTSLASPATERMITLDLEKAMANRKTLPPKLPQRPGSGKSLVTKPLATKSPPTPSYPIRRVASSSRLTPSSPIPTPILTSSSSAFATSYTPRRVAPPPPQSRASDRSSIASITTTYSFSSSSQSPQSHNLSLKTKRPTPVPLAARKRYEAVFNANVIQRRKAERRKLQEKPALLSVTEARSRRAIGWRGLSVDLLTINDAAQQPNNGNGSAVDDIVGPNEKLEGPIIRQIWKYSGLHNSRLAEIWNGCDLTGQGALSLEAFVKGMWRIDEELRRMQLQAFKTGSNTSLGSYRSNTHRSNIIQKPRDILR